jgi:signal peptidase II
MAMRRRFLLSSLFLFVVGCDQATKSMVAWKLTGSSVDVIPGFFSLVYAENPGIAFSGFMSLSPTYRLPLIIAMVSTLFLIVLAVFWRTPWTATLQKTGYGLIAAGALGNLLDRVRLGYVIDFIEWRVKDHVWPVFNVADAAVVAGVALLLLARPAETPAKA